MPLINKYGRRLIYDTNLEEETKVESIIHNGRWHWRVHTGAIQHITMNTPTDFLPDSNKRDVVVWKPDRKGKFTVKSCWEALRRKEPEVYW